MPKNGIFSRTIQTRSELYRLSLGSIITLTFSVLCNLDLLPADQLSVFHQFFSEKISSFLKGRMISKEINQGLYKAGPEFPFETLMTFKEGWNFSQFCPEINWDFSSFSLLTFDLLRSLSFFYCGFYALFRCNLQNEDITWRILEIRFGSFD